MKNKFKARQENYKMHVRTCVFIPKILKKNCINLLPFSIFLETEVGHIGIIDWNNLLLKLQKYKLLPFAPDFFQHFSLSILEDKGYFQKLYIFSRWWLFDKPKLLQPKPIRSAPDKEPKFEQQQRVPRGESRTTNKSSKCGTHRR